MTYDPRNPTDAAGVCNFRLTTETTVPVSISNRTSQSTIYLTPYKGNCIGLKVGGVWRTFNSGEISKGLGTLTNDKNYSVYAYWTGTAVDLEFQAWSTDTADDGHTLDAKGGVWVRTADDTRLLVGMFRTTSTTTTEDSDTKRYVVNLYNQVWRHCVVQDTTNTGTGPASANTWADYNANTGLSLAALLLKSGEVQNIIGLGIVSNSTTTAGLAGAGVGFNFTGVGDFPDITGAGGTEQTGISIVCQNLTTGSAAGIGYVPVQMRFRVDSTANDTWYGDNGGTVVQAGMMSIVRI